MLRKTVVSIVANRTVRVCICRNEIRKLTHVAFGYRNHAIQLTLSFLFPTVTCNHGCKRVLANNHLIMMFLMCLIALLGTHIRSSNTSNILPLLPLSWLLIAIISFDILNKHWEVKSMLMFIQYKLLYTIPYNLLYP